MRPAGRREPVFSRSAGPTPSGGRSYGTDELPDHGRGPHDRAAAGGRARELGADRRGRAGDTAEAGRGRDEPRPQASPSRGRRFLARASALALVVCLVFGGSVVLGDQTAAASVVPVRPTFRSVMSPALVSGAWLCLSSGYCEVRLDKPRVGDRAPAFDPAASSLGDGPLTGSELFSGAGQVFGREGVFALQGTEAYEGWAFLGAWWDPMNGDRTLPRRARG